MLNLHVFIVVHLSDRVHFRNCAVVRK